MKISPLNPGDQFPQFSLTAPTGEVFTDQTYAGQDYIVYFYPRASTPGCTAQACGLEEALAQQNLKLPVIGVSPDPLKRIENFAKKYNLTFPLVSDEDKAFAQACGIYGDKTFMGITKPGVHRIAFIVDAQGKVKHTFKRVKAKEFAQQVLEYLAKNA